MSDSPDTAASSSIKDEEQSSSVETPDVEMKDATSEAPEDVKGDEDDEAEEVEEESGDQVEGSVPPQTETTNVVDLKEEQQKLDEKAKQYLARQVRPVVIPSYAAWFDMNSIHEIEKRSLPEFFETSKFKSAKIYKEFRDFMINAYRLNPMEFLTVTAARRNLAGDVASIMRVHGFLQKWGLINYQVDPRTRPSLSGPQYTGHFQITLDTPEGLAPFIPPNAEILVKKEESANGESNGSVEASTVKAEPSDIPFNLEVRRNVYDSTLDSVTLRGEEKERFSSSVIGIKQVFCNVCGNDATVTRYHNLRSKNNVCSKCFEQGHFPSNFQSSDFVKLEKASASSDATSWSSQEVLLLLEGIEMYDEDWNKICGHVGSRTKEQCISKFIQLPIEDRYLEQTISRKIYEKKKGYSNGAHSNGVSNGVNSPLQAFDKTIEFLTGKVSAEVAKKSVAVALGSSDDKEGVDDTIVHSAKTALGVLAASAQAQLVESQKSQEEIIRQLVELELKKIEVKLSKLVTVEKVLETEKKSLAQKKRDLLIDRLALRKQASIVHEKLQKAAELGATEEGLQLCSEAVVEANRAPKVFVTRKPTAAELVSETELVNGSKEQSIAPDFEPVSIGNPQAYKFWSG
ncbi:unnamed protein product [Kuraishia capsulata CBS 1993]|uniref:SWIRM domain-containing protein n=1 Tax=Kuraishia capsulata CBS 1993 TaxID=1382522 RepID=W6MHB2_9ASCO|nr:uncharacterized protein KUCA_T00001000001 [Kuraishia capsulata CBS 1993]CDK25033.1 unnamed protein product [Kuraishia capsulata CBS 1993]